MKALLIGVIALAITVLVGQPQIRGAQECGRRPWFALTDGEWYIVATQGTACCVESPAGSGNWSWESPASQGFCTQPSQAPWCANRQVAWTWNGGSRWRECDHSDDEKKACKDAPGAYVSYRDAITDCPLTNGCQYDTESTPVIYNTLKVEGTCP